MINNHKLSIIYLFFTKLTYLVADNFQNSYSDYIFNYQHFIYSQRNFVT